MTGNLYINKNLISLLAFIMKIVHY